MRAACPTPVSVVEEDVQPSRSVGGYQTPVYNSRCRVTKGLTCRKAVSCEPDARETFLSPTTNLRGKGILRGPNGHPMTPIGYPMTPNGHPMTPIGYPMTPNGHPMTPITPLPTPSHAESGLAETAGFEVEPLPDICPSLASEGDPDTESLYSLSVTGRNPTSSDSSMVDWHSKPVVHAPPKAASSEHQCRPQSRKPPMFRDRTRKVQVPVKSLNIGGFGLPYPCESQPTCSKDYKPGRVTNTSFDCFRCEYRMTAHDAHQWFESLLVSSRVRGERRGIKVNDRSRKMDRKYSKDEISRALFPRYWSKQCLSPDPRPRSQMKTPSTRPPTQTPDTISGPWRAGCSRADSRDGMMTGQMTREDLQGFCGGHAKSKCKTSVPHGPQLAPCRPYHSDTQLGVSIVAGADLWCHSADLGLRVETGPGTRVEVESSFVSDSHSRNTMSSLSQNGKASRLSVHSNGHGQPSGRMSSFEVKMRIQTGNPEDMFYELHEEDEEGQEDEDPDREPYPDRPYTDPDSTVCSCSTTQIKSQCRISCQSFTDGRDPYNDKSEQFDGGHFEMVAEECHSQRGRSCSNADMSQLCCCSTCSALSDNIDGERSDRYCSSSGYGSAYYPGSAYGTAYCPSSGYGTAYSPSRVSTAIDRCEETPTAKPRSQVNCNMSAADRSPSLEIKGSKAGTGMIRDPRTMRTHSRQLKDIQKEAETPIEKEVKEEGLATAQVNLENDLEGFQDDDQEEEDEEEEEEGEEEHLPEEQDDCFFRRLCESAQLDKQAAQSYPDLPKPLGRHFCYAPIVDKRYNRWRRRKPKKRKRTMKMRRNEKTSSSTSDESTNVPDGRDSKRSKRSRKHGATSRSRASRQASRNAAREQESINLKEFQFEPVFDQSYDQSFDQSYDQSYDQSDWAEDSQDTQFPDSTEACTDSSKSSLTSSGSRVSASVEPTIIQSFTSPSSVTFVDLADLQPQPPVPAMVIRNQTRSPEADISPEVVLEQTRARSRVASIPSKNCPRTQKSLLSLSLRGPSLEKDVSNIDPMQALPRAGGRLPLLKTQRSVLARSSDSIMSRIPCNVSYLSRMERRMGWIKRGIMQRSSDPSMMPLPKMELKLAAEKYTMSPPPKSPVPKTRMTKGPAKNNKSTIPRAKAATTEKFTSVIRGKKASASKKRKDTRNPSLMSVYLADEEDEEFATFTLKDLLSTLPGSSDTDDGSQEQYAGQQDASQAPSIFSNFVKGSHLHKRSLRQPMERSISALSFTPAFTFSVYTLPEAYRSRNVGINKVSM